MNNSDTNQNKQLNETDVMRSLLIALSEGKYKCDVDYPNFRKIKSEIIEIDFQNISWKPVKVRFLEKGLLENIETYEEVEIMGYMGNDTPTQLVKKQVPVTETWVMLDWLSNYA